MSQLEKIRERASYYCRATSPDRKASAVPYDFFSLVEDLIVECQLLEGEIKDLRGRLMMLGDPLNA